MVDDNSGEEEGEGESGPQSLVEQHKADLKKKSKKEMKEEQRRKDDEEKASKEERLREVYTYNVLVLQSHVEKGKSNNGYVTLALHCDLVSITLYMYAPDLL